MLKIKDEFKVMLYQSADREINKFTALNKIGANNEAQIKQAKQFNKYYKLIQALDLEDEYQKFENANDIFKNKKNLAESTQKKTTDIKKSKKFER